MLARSLRRQRTRAALAETRAALFDSGSRRRLSKLTLARGIETRARAFAALALAAPPLARRLAPRGRPPDQRFLADP